MVTGVVNNNSENITNKERSILSIVFFDSEIAWLEESFLSDKILNFNKINWNHNLDDSDNFELLSTAFENDNFNTEKVIAAVANQNYCLVPDAYFEKDKAAFYLEKNTGKIAAGSCKYFRIPSINVWCCYFLDHRLDMFMQNVFPGINIIHESAVLIEKLMLSANKNEYVLWWQSNVLNIGIKREGKLKFFNTFKAENIEEVLYYMSLSGEKCNINFQEEFAQIKTNNKIIVSDKLKNFFPKLQLENQEEKDRYYSLHHLSVCA